MNCLNEVTEWQVFMFLLYDENRPDVVKSVWNFLILWPLARSVLTQNIELKTTTNGQIVLCKKSSYITFLICQTHSRPRRKKFVRFSISMHLHCQVGFTSGRNAYRSGVSQFCLRCEWKQNHYKINLTLQGYVKWNWNFPDILSSPVGKITNVEKATISAYRSCKSKKRFERCNERKWTLSHFTCTNKFHKWHNNLLFWIFSIFPLLLEQTKPSTIQGDVIRLFHADQQTFLTLDTVPKTKQVGFYSLS